ncbi:4Fe-4S dicluster domain-containing protein [Pseudactinotalea sp. HY160]|uniref:4Fe-4S dicluster domain-containing protein n=1 Tax=Pseudactinotalea sp. HY160 TaxID=2654490 RepID=UPI00128B2960|nr:4Fe-4S dicluster domain-containing protein [Pseudactinotalea sp. HY160]MPV50458.1 4Fe-4S dicluster domain-containing protein [Pseudactinotalea sp. HY160]
MGQLFGRTDPAPDAGWTDAGPRKGFFTDTSICIGCKACEVACKEWNQLPAAGAGESGGLLGSSYDNTGALGADTWRHVAFIEQDSGRIAAARESGRRLVDLGMPTLSPAAGGSMDGARSPRVDALAAAGASDGIGVPGGAGAHAGVDVLGDTEGSAHPDTPEFRWLMASDVCKHCTHAACLDVCPTGALFRSEFGSVVVQDDVCNGCGACVAACPFGVIERRADGVSEPGRQRPQAEAVGHSQGGIAQKCTLCYDRLTEGEQPACAQTCPTESIRFGERDELVERARRRVGQLHSQGMTEARLYGANENDGVGGTGSVFLLLDEPEAYGLPPDPRVCTADLPGMYARAGLAAAGMLAAAALAFARRGGRA